MNKTVCLIRLNTGEWGTPPTLALVASLLRGFHEWPPSTVDTTTVELAGVDDEEEDSLVLRATVHTKWKHSEAVRDCIFEMLLTLNPEYDSMIEIDLME